MLLKKNKKSKFVINGKEIFSDDFDEENSVDEN